MADLKAQTSMNPSLRIEGLHVRHGDILALDDISFELAPGSFLGILGANGSGKSTLLSAIAGATRPENGRILINGAEPGQPERARETGGSGDRLIRPAGFNIRNFALLGRYPWLSWLGIYGERDYKAVREALVKTGIHDIADQEVATLSSGQWQLACLARGLTQLTGAREPVLLLDEPAANLDLGNTISVFKTVRELLGFKWTVLVAIHDCNLAAIFCTHLLGLKKGKILFFGQMRDVFTCDNLSALYGWPVGIYEHPELGIPQIYTRLDPGGSPAGIGH